MQYPWADAAAELQHQAPLEFSLPVRGGWPGLEVLCLFAHLAEKPLPQAWTCTLLCPSSPLRPWGCLPTSEPAASAPSEAKP